MFQCIPNLQISNIKKMLNFYKNKFSLCCRIEMSIKITVSCSKNRHSL